MRKLVLVGCILLSTSVYARGRRTTKPAPAPAADSHVAVVDDEPTHAPQGLQKSSPASKTEGGLDTGSMREVQINAPHVADVGTAPGSLVEKGASEDPSKDRAASYQPVSGVLEELAARQMRKNQGAIDTCVAKLKKRNAAATGTVALKLSVGEKRVVLAEIGENSVGDKQLETCLVTAARKWTFSLSNASFTHSVLVAK
jgi:hypothetical protein